MAEKTFLLYDQMVALSHVVKEALDIKEELTSADTNGILDLMNDQKVLLESMLISHHLAGKEAEKDSE